MAKIEYLDCSNKKKDIFLMNNIVTYIIIIVFEIFVCIAFHIPNEKNIINNYDSIVLDKYISFTCKNNLNSIGQTLKIVTYENNKHDKIALIVNEQEYIKYNIGDKINVNLIEYKNPILKSKKIYYEINNVQ